MGHHARGDSQKIMYSSEDEEGYENYCRNISFHLNVRDKQHFTTGFFGEVPPIPKPPTSDDTDRQFWAEDELSSSESKQQLNRKRKRRRSLSYRNRLALQRSRSLLFQSSSSSSDSVHVKISPEAPKRGKYRRPSGRLKIEELDKRNNAREENIYARIKVVPPLAASKNSYTESQTSTSQRPRAIRTFSPTERLKEHRLQSYSMSSSSNGSQSHCNTTHQK